MERYCGKVGVVTGASSGIGKSIAIRLAYVGLKVVGLARRVTMIEVPSDGRDTGRGSLVGLKCDLRNASEIKAAFKHIKQKFGHVSVLVNSAGEYSPYTIREIERRNIYSAVNTNIIGMMTCTKEALASMEEGCVENGHIVNVNCIAGHKVPFTGDGVYTATKHAMTGFTESLRHELACDDSKIKITSITPGLVETELTEQYIKSCKKKVPKLTDCEIASCVMYALAAPTNVNISEIFVQGTGAIMHGPRLIH